MSIFTKEFVPMRKLGSGQFATVRLARRKADQQLYAVKHIEVSADPNEANAVLQEIHILASLEHPFIIRYFDSRVETRDLYVVMEYAPNGSLHDVLTQQQKASTHLPEAVIWRYLLQLLMGLHQIHSRLVVHRDIKPHNIFLGDNDTVKIGDFGVSRLRSNSREMATTLVGSPGYLAPELCNGEPYNEKCDIWSLGVTIAELCMLQHPFGNTNSQAALIMKIMKAQPPELPSLYSHQLNRLLASCFHRRLSQRPSALQILSLSSVKQYAPQLGLVSFLPAEAAAPQPAKAKIAEMAEMGRQLGADTHAPPPGRSHRVGTNVREAAMVLPEGRGVPLFTMHEGLDGREAPRLAQHSARVARRGSNPDIRQQSEGPAAWDLKPVCASKKGSSRAGSSGRQLWGSSDRPVVAGLDDESRPTACNAPLSRRESAHRVTSTSRDAQPEKPSARERSAGSDLQPTLWAKRRNSIDPCPGALGDDLDALSFDQNVKKAGLDSPLDAFAAQHCPAPRLMKAHSAVSDSVRRSSGADRFADSCNTSSPLAALVKREFPRPSSELQHERAPTAGMHGGLYGGCEPPASHAGVSSAWVTSAILDDSHRVWPKSEGRPCAAAGQANAALPAPNGSYGMCSHAHES